ncbi:MAG TPA: hypothetical protein VE955_07515 [Candidatus Dormibacteraeota bacterium]|jgi:hypothetical protein|nr:hypothetical protein [Candidatus Dormibacteraeota bacterium]
MSSAYWRINPVSIIGAAIALISVILPWWGIYRIFGTSATQFARWALYNPPGTLALRHLGQPEQVSASTISQTFTVSSLLVLTLALVVAALALAGGLTLLRKYLVAGIALSILTLAGYAITIAYLTSNYCILSPLCASGPIGTATIFGTTFTWGFETGFYFFLVALVVLALSLVLNNSLARTNQQTTKLPASQSS